MKLSKQQVKAHEDCLRLLDKATLTYEEKCFVYENWYPAYGNQIGKIASFFTPFGLAQDFQLSFSGKSVIDLCAGIGILSFLYYHKCVAWEGFEPRIVCLERNNDFIAVGEKLFPEATWVSANVLDQQVIKSLGRFSTAISNPPFGNIKSDMDGKWLKYTGGELDLKVVEIAGYLADTASFILPQMSVPFKYSGQSFYQSHDSNKYEKFSSQTEIDISIAVGIDCSVYKDEWKGASPAVEICSVEQYPDSYQRKPVDEEQQRDNQLSLF